LNNQNNTIGRITVSDGKLIFKDNMSGMAMGGLINNADVEVNIGAGLNKTYAYPLSGSGTFTKTGDGILQFNGGGQPIAQGQFYLQAGVLQNNNNSVNWSGNTGGMDISSGATLDLYADAITVDALTGSGTVRNGYAPDGLQTLTVGVANGSGTFSGTILGIGGGVALTKTGTGTQTLAGANTYTGTTTVSDGTLTLQGGAFSTTARSYVIGAAGVLNLDGNTDVASGTTTISGGGVLRVTGGSFMDTVGPGRNITMSLGGGALIDVQAGAKMTNGGWQNITWTSNFADLNVDGTLDIWDGKTVIVDALTGSGTVTHTSYGASTNLTVGVDNGSGIFGGTITETSGHAVSLTKQGTGVQTLSGVNTYTGTTTVNQGTLLVDGTLGGNVDVQAGGTFSAGSQIGHLLITGASSYTQTGTMLVELDGMTPGTEYDWIEVNDGAADVGGLLDIVLTGDFRPETRDSFDVLTATGGVLDTGILLDWDSTLLRPAQYWTHSIADLGGGAQALRLELAAPEPSSAILAVLGLLGLGWFGWRRKR